MESKSQIIEDTKAFVKKKMLTDTTGHDYWHVMRVYSAAKQIAKEESADVFVVEVASLLHDIGKHGAAKEHAESCAEEAGKFLGRFDLPSDTLQHILDCISTHCWDGRAGEPQTLEAKIVADSDALDGCGAVGVVRTIGYCISKNIPIHDPDKKPNKEFLERSETMVNHFYEKLLHVDKTMHTKTAKRIAKQRIEFMQGFLDELLEEWVTE